MGTVANMALMEPTGQSIITTDVAHIAGTEARSMCLKQLFLLH